MSDYNLSVTRAYVQEALKLRGELFPRQGVLDTLLILSYELGAVIKALFYADGGINTEVHRAWAKSEMVDVLAQSFALCEEMGWDFGELLDLGVDKFHQRMVELKQRRQS